MFMLQNGDGHYDKGDNYEKILSAVRVAIGEEREVSEDEDDEK